jgi:Transcriptional activator of glycolytic enzymes
MNGQRSMEELERTWGMKWRQGKGQGPWWARRKRILDEIERVRVSRGCSMEAAVAEVELLRASNGWSINRLYEHYLKEAKRQKS